MHALAFEGVEVHGERGRQRLAFARAHFGDLAVVENHGADKLYVEVTHAHHAAARFSHDRKGFGQQCVECFALTETFAEFVGLAAQLFVCESQHFGLELVDLDAALAVLTNQAVVAAAENLGKKRIKHISTG